MISPLNLGDSVIGAATAAAGEVITSSADINGATQAYLEIEDDVSAVLLSVNFTYGSGGSTLKVIVETSVDGGTTWTEVYRAAFTTASGQRLVNLSALTPVSPYTPAALSDDAVKDGIIGPRWRARKIVSGTYAGNSSLSVRMVPRR
ncbi:hypothetical protein CCR97_08245 [Rhodoplanes elegans]|uniref:F5/8 type C domain-containing protein n=1 Tax=Rhodoplanes elegans TaxID=29408 RepID=A0A327KVI0_9BRAD|nr:hypothetical protein [Rhodoplanes elegans]MBK5958109.1 hypothetical protein [Rhodoplanes elegans]MBK5958201.1 hypothetical protein [Rhodoplanes elegans]RAI41984.1 hypothetical protein CH338_01385 [Rhodoplanes elegans]